VAWSTTDLGLDSATTVLGGYKDLAIALATTPLVGIERTLGFRQWRTAAPYVAKHVTTAAEFGFTERWQASRRFTLLATVAMLAQETPVVGSFVPGARGNMNGPVTRVVSGGINASSWARALSREGETRTNVAGYGVGGTQRLAPYDRGTVVEVILGMFFGYKARGLEWTDQVLSGVDGESGVAPGGTLHSDGHSGGVIRTSIGSNYIAAYGIGVARQFSEQGPAVGFYANIGELSANYSLWAPGGGALGYCTLPLVSLGREPTSWIGALLSPLYWAPGPVGQHHFSVQGDLHRQGGMVDPDSGATIGNEWNLDRALFMW